MSTKVEARRVKGGRLLDLLTEVMRPNVRVKSMTLRVTETGEVEVVDCEYEVETS
jgi:hypothetical protein